MVTLYVRGQKVGTLPEGGKLLTELVEKRQVVELRDDAGNRIATITPEEPPASGGPDIPWEPGVTWEEIERRAKEPGFSIEEVRKRLGWA